MENSLWPGGAEGGEESVLLLPSCGWGLEQRVSTRQPASHESIEPDEVDEGTKAFTCISSLCQHVPTLMPKKNYAHQYSNLLDSDLSISQNNNSLGRMVQNVFGM